MKRMTWLVPAAVGLSLVCCAWAWLPSRTRPPVPRPTPTVVLRQAQDARVWPPPQAMVEHYFGPLGARDVEVALAVGDCETGGTWDPSLVGAHGELGLFQLLPRGGAGQRFAEAGWNLLDARENVIAAALVVARDGWSSWSACLP